MERDNFVRVDVFEGALRPDAEVEAHRRMIRESNKKFHMQELTAKQEVYLKRRNMNRPTRHGK